MPTYEDLKSELDQIAATLKKFPESVQPRVFDVLIDTYIGKANGGGHEIGSRKPSPTEHAKSTSQKDSGGQKKKRKTGGSESFSIDPDLDLTAHKNSTSFQQFHSEKAPKTNREFNAIAVYYLQEFAKISPVELDQVYTCYREVNRKPPQAFRQSFTDAKNKDGWLSIDDNWGLGVTHRGRIVVEHDLPRKASD